MNHRPGAALGCDYDVARYAHARHFAALLTRLAPELYGRGQEAAAKHLRLEQENLLEALDALLELRDAEGLLPFARYLTQYFSLIGSFGPAFGSYTRLLDVALRVGHSELEQHSRYGLGSALQRLGRLDEADEHLQRGLKLAEASADAATMGRILNVLGTVAWQHGQLDLAEAHYRAALGMRRAVGDLYGVSQALNNLGILASYHGRHQQSYDLFAESLALEEQIGDVYGLPTGLNNLGLAAKALGNIAEADSLFQRSLLLHRSFGNRHGEAMALSNLAMLHRGASDPHGATRLYRQALGLWHEVGDRYGEAMSLCGLSYALRQGGETTEAAAVAAQTLELTAARDFRMVALEAVLNAAGLCALAGRHAQAALLLAGVAAQTKAAGYPLLDETIAAEQAVLREVAPHLDCSDIDARGAALDFSALCELALAELRDLAEE